MSVLTGDLLFRQDTSISSSCVMVAFSTHAGMLCSQRIKYLSLPECTQIGAKPCFGNHIPSRPNLTTALLPEDTLWSIIQKIAVWFARVMPAFFARGGRLCN